MNLKRNKTYKTQLDSEHDPEMVTWSDCGKYLYVAMEDGHVIIFNYKDFTKKNQNVGRKFKANEGGCTFVSSTHNKRLLMTTGTDGFARVWDICQNEKEPVMIEERKLGDGKPVFCGARNPDDKCIFAFGGSEIFIWDISCETYAEQITQFCEKFP